MMQYWDYLPLVRRIFYEYVIPRVAVKNTDYILELYPRSIDYSFGLSKFPKQVFIYVETIRDILRKIGISQLIEKDYVYMLTTLTMIHEVLHLEQDISMCYYGINESYRNQVESQVEHRAMEILKMDAKYLEKTFGFVCNFMMINFGYSDKYQVYEEADVKTWYWNTMINSVLVDIIRGPKILERLRYDMDNDLYVDIEVRMQDVSRTNCRTCLVKSNGEYLMSSIPQFADMVHGFCSRWTRYRVLVITREVPARDGLMNLMIQFTISDWVNEPMLFASDV